MRLPYGISHFPSIREQNQVFIDHTHYIRLLEENDAHLMFLRPRRSASSAVRLVFNAVKKAKQQVYLLIDEYDNFNNIKKYRRCWNMHWKQHKQTG